MSYLYFIFEKIKNIFYEKVEPMESKYYSKKSRYAKQMKIYLNSQTA